MKSRHAAILGCVLIFSNSSWAVISLLPPPTVTPSPAPSAPSSVSINPAANTGQNAENGASGANDAVGAALIAAGMALMSNPQTMPQGMALMAMGMLALAQGAADSGAAGQSGQTAAASVSSGTGATTTTASSTPTPPSDSGINAAFQTPAGQQAITAIQQAGGSVSEEGVTMPDGTTKSWSAFSSGGAMSANGFDGVGAMKTVADIEKKLGLDQAQAGNDGALAEGASAGAGQKPAMMPLPKFMNPFAMNAAQKAKLAAGKTLLTASGEPIGVKMDNLFAIIHRAYDRQRTTNNFINDPNGKAQDEDISTKSLVQLPDAGLIKRSPASIDTEGGN